MVATIALPRLMRVGERAFEQLPLLLRELGLSKPLIVTDAYLNGTGRIAQAVEMLALSGINAGIFADTVPDPTVDSVMAGVRSLSNGEYDCVVGIGGGSPIDTAKAIAVIGRHGGVPADYKVPHVQDVPGLPIIAVPTTAGSGSEATRFTVITDGSTDEKMLCAGIAYLPIAAVIDYELTLTKPRRLTADTGIDSLTHAIEAYVSQRANPLSDRIALAAMELIAPNLRRVFDDGNDREAREAMMLGATLAGMAFSNASVALVHGMSRPIGAHFHVPHGLSNAMLLPAVTTWSSQGAIPRYARCARAMGVATDDEGDQASVARLLKELTSINRDLQVPTPAAWGISAERWDALVPVMTRQAIASGSPANNPRVPTAEDIAIIYQQIFA
ncbi:alcohol dehydrogenase [Sphingomonas sp. Leaf208]|uniref:iron-containing alcohol dehydrogenase n=1 Tax=Sphingomonas sp. Leaf208 TaxID=1735679 RepID=UPI0006F1E8F2|nr:iron-containing alcohol dehydrogenase [Sphingomonas sp. Leaf208]KQM52438.1 alcohol dehydrogenase [Sphingomonas sp. Leaf208]